MIIRRIRTSTRSVLNHPFIVIAFLFVAFLYKLSPFLFSLLLSASPVLVCTVVLLGTLLTFADPQLPEIENVRNERSVLLQNHTVTFSKDDPKTEKVTQISSGKLDEYSSREIVVTNRNHEEIPTFQAKPTSLYEESVDDHFESSSMPWTRMNDDEEQDEDEDSGSDGDESSSIEPSMADIIPLLDEIDPLIECENSDLLSTKSHDSNEETDHKEAEDEEEEENQENKEEEKSAIIWTEDDQKNLMDLGSSELERNQRLESLIARRRARKNMKMMKEKNLIDLDGFDLPYQVPIISTARQNPFEFPNVTYDDMGLPPIPGSAPSILLPRRNPFDLPYDSSEEKPDLSSDGFQQEFMDLNHKEPVFRRHESFSIGSSIFEYPRKDRLEATRGSRFRPYFVADRLVGDGFMRQSSEISDSSSFQRQESGVSDESSSYRRQSSDVSESKGSEGVMLSSEMDLGSVHDDQYGNSDFDLHLREIRLGESENRVNRNDLDPDQSAVSLPSSDEEEFDDQIEKLFDRDSNVMLQTIEEEHVGEPETQVNRNDPDPDTWMFEDRDVDESVEKSAVSLPSSDEEEFVDDRNVMLQTIEEEHVSISSSSSVVSDDHNNTESLKHDEVLDNDSDVPTEQDPVYDSSPRGSKIHVLVSSEEMLEEFAEPELVNEDTLMSEESGLYPDNLDDVPRNVEEKVNSAEDNDQELFVVVAEKTETSYVENADNSGLDGSFTNINVESNLEAEVVESIKISNDEETEIFKTIESREIPDKVLKLEEIEVSSTKDKETTSTNISTLP